MKWPFVSRARHEAAINAMEQEARLRDQHYRARTALLSRSIVEMEKMLKEKAREDTDADLDAMGFFK